MRSTIAVATAVLVLMTVPASAEEEPPRIVDPIGDANSVFIEEEGPDTRPASDDRADILEVWPETLYDTVKETDADGTTLAVRHVPRALRVNVKTTAPASPATGPTLRFHLPVAAGGCAIEFDFFVHGLLTAPDDIEEEAVIDDTPPDGANFNFGCIGARLRSDEFNLTFDGDVTRMTFPFEALVGTPAEDLVAPGIALEPRSGAGFIRVRRLTTGYALFGYVDLASPLPAPFVIGSDVPPDVDCVATPEHQACSG